jgi:hypothetical protein
LRRKPALPQFDGRQYRLILPRDKAAGDRYILADEPQRG